MTLTGNTSNSDGPLFEIVGTPPSITTAPYLNNYLIITDNTFASGYYAKGYRGGTSAASSTYRVSNLYIEGEHLSALRRHLRVAPAREHLFGT